MSRLSIQRKSDVKPFVSMKEPSKGSKIEFRWSTVASQSNIMREKSSLSNFQNNKQKKSFNSSISCSTVHNSIINRLPCSTTNLSSSSTHLPIINNMNKKNELSISTNSNNNNKQKCPLLLTYSQLYRAQPLSQMKKTPQAKFSIYSLLNNKHINKTTVNENSLSSSSSSDQQQLTTDRYIRLRTPQLRRLNVSDKYMKEAKKLYFNVNCKVFVPYSSIVEVS
ncbi:unnamed protein product [Adineta steineri]|uniref:Uncharacterized protein n=1 Tax=Adineta steineri TaxID=433720 RepID=A0A818RKS8_9BILA|nr:unnamed protein product [Adineta steineri]